MDNLENQQNKQRSQNEPLPFEPDKQPSDEPIPFDDSDQPQDNEMSRSPLDLSGSSEVQIRRTASSQDKPHERKPAVETESSPDRITGVKTFFTKLHPGALEFLDQQIISWLKANPSLTVKATNTTVGEIQAKKTEPNIIVTVWY